MSDCEKKPDSDKFSPCVPQEPLRIEPVCPSRRRMLGQLLVGGAGLAAGAIGASYASNEEAILAAKLNENDGEKESLIPDAISSASRKHTNWTKLDALKEPCPMGRIGDMKVSQVILGGNLVGGWAHARDLIYVSDLVKAYHTEEKVFATFSMAEACGINTFLTNPVMCDIMERYWDKTSGKMQFISDCGGGFENLPEIVQYSIDRGAHSCYVQGETADRAVREERFDVIEKSLETIRKNGLGAGIGAHRLETVQACVKHGLIPDYWMKTYHHLNYWSARPEQECDNVFCRNPEGTKEFMAERKEPWIAFKTLAAGSIHPRDGFKYAIEGGADFLCVGMYDFQIVDDVNIFNEIMNGPLERTRPWFTEHLKGTRVTR